jgi:hypothetical protein
MVYRITHDNELRAIVISHNFSDLGIHFFTPENFSQQLGYQRHPTGKVIPPHLHNSVSREMYYTQEVLFIKRGKLRVDFYDESKIYLKSHILETGDAILLVSGGHGFEVLDEVEIIEVRQGPYGGDLDKTRFMGMRTHSQTCSD